jgi:hypothetical protein
MMMMMMKDEGMCENRKNDAIKICPSKAFHHESETLAVHILI